MLYFFWLRDLMVKINKKVKMSNLTDLKIKNKKTKEVKEFNGLNSIELKDIFKQFTLGNKYSDYTFTEYNYLKD
jgi:hypothetical protein